LARTFKPTVPRLPRFNVPGVAQHVTLRGNNRSACFFDDNDRLAYLAWLGEAAEQHGIAVHAYVLMTNHVHLLVTPERAGAVSAAVQMLGRRYVRHINRKYARTGTLYEGRYKACVIDSERYLLTAYRYIDLNPVRALLVQHPRDYRWSSYRVNAGLGLDPLICAHESYVALGTTHEQRAEHYRALCADAIDPMELAELRAMSAKELAYGCSEFKDILAQIARRRTRPARFRAEVSDSAQGLQEQDQ
jgi:putative transposase